MKIPITKPYIGEEEVRAMQQVLESGWLVQGDNVAEFEAVFEKFTGSAFAVATTSCTTALHLAAVLQNLERGDEVIVPAFTWVGTANAVEAVGATPVFCDIDIQTFNIDVEKIEQCITDKTVGIIPVHLFGLCADMGRIQEIAKAHNLWVVEDAACATGSYYNGQHAGTFGNAGCFSFHPRKVITTGEGGMLVVKNKQDAVLARSLREHGASVTDQQRHRRRTGFLLSEYNVLGYNYRMTDMQGVLGVVQMKRLPWIIERRQALAARYNAALQDISWLHTPTVPSGYEHSYQSYVCMMAVNDMSGQVIDKLSRRRSALMAEMEDKGVSLRQGSHAAFIQGYYQRTYRYVPEDFLCAYAGERISLSLPLYPQMTEKEQDVVIECLHDVDM